MSHVQKISNFEDTLEPSSRMPVLFVGHGSPMNAITDNRFRRNWQRLGESLPKPQAILCVSAHWLTKGTFVTAMKSPETIHDFGGFPKELFKQQYPAPGSPGLAEEVQQLSQSFRVGADLEWGLDHGAWAVLKPMYPLADIPVVQLSLDYDAPISYHVELANSLRRLREMGVLVVGSGNLVHNLQRIDMLGTVYDWAIEFDRKLTGLIEKGDLAEIMNFQKWGSISKMAHPTFDHLLPLFYVLGMTYENESPEFFNDQFDFGSVSMRSVLFHE